MINRILASKLKLRWEDEKALVIYGPRQVGKTTLISELTQNESCLWLSGDESDVHSILGEPNSTKLKSLIGNHKFVVIDEAQRIKNIGLVIKIFIDQVKSIKVIASGSSSFELANQVNEELTGRKWDFMLFPISFSEMVNHHTLLDEKRMLEHRLVFGYYPEIVTATESFDLRLKILADSYLYKDILSLDQVRKPEKLQKLLQALAFQIGGEVSNFELSQVCGIDRETVERYLDLLEKTFVIFTLTSFSRNLRNELKKSKKIYFLDNGMRNAIINRFSPIGGRDDLGKLWENFLMSERYKLHSYQDDRVKMYFWRTTEKQEIDLVEEMDGQLNAFEFTWSEKKKKRISKTFTNSYPNTEFKVVNNENFDEFLAMTMIKNQIA